tara:strand:+ start:74789 stop:76177 length:1389 start_codon:yes stop_codon:yes gene_type:complete
VKSPTIQLLEPELIELLEARDYRQVRDALSILEPADIADLIESLDIEAAGLAFRILPRQMASDVFSELEQPIQESLLDELGDERSARVVEALEPDDRAAILDELPVEVATQIIKRLSPENRRITQAILGYEADSVGRLMTPGYVRIRKSWTVDHALEHIRKYGQNAERVDWVFVISADGTLIDDLHIRTILLADPTLTVADIMDDQFVALNAKEDREEAVRAMARYNRTALPVVDSLGLLVGIVTADDIADVAEEEFTEDVQKLGGMEALDSPYTNTPVKDMVRKRGVWLVGLFGLQLLSIGVMGIFNDQLEKAVVLALFVPLIIASGGNTGTQAASLLVRAIAVEEVHIGLWWRIMRKEILTGLILGAVLGIMGVLTVHMLSAIGFAHTDHAQQLAITVGIAVFFIVIWGTLIGSMLPLVMQKLGLDPAASSAPLVATLMDVSGLTIYFAVAILLLSGTIL